MKAELSTPWAWRAALCAIALAAYANSFGLGLAYDGAHLAAGDPRVAAATWENVKLIFGTPYWYPTAEDFLYRPLTTLSFLGSGGNAAVCHAINFLLHALNVLLVFELARRLLGGLPAFFAAAIWALHPIGTEAVANVAGRADLLAAAAVLGALVVYAADRPGVRGAWSVAVLCAAGALAKESAMVLPGLMLLWDLTAGRRPRPATSAAVLGAFAAVLAIRAAVFHAAAWPAQQFVDNPLRGIGFWPARLTALKIIGMDLGLLVWPANLAFDHSYQQIPPAAWRDMGVWVTGIVVFEVLLLVTLRRRRDPVLFFAAGFYGLTLLPASNLVVLIGSIMAVRFSYLPAVGFAIAASALAFRLRNRRITYALLGTAVVLLATRTLARNPAWDSDLALASADVESAPQSYRVHRLLSNSLVKANPDANLDAAVREGERAWEILAPLPPGSSDPNAAADLGYLYELKGDRAGGGETAEGRAWYGRAAELLKTGATMAAASRRSFDEEQLAHGKPLRFRGGYELLYLNLGKAYATLGRFDEAMNAFRKARAENPHERKAYLGMAAAALSRGDADTAAVVTDEMAMLFGVEPETAARLRAIYPRIPGGECALREEGGQVRLDLGCPRAAHDVCSGWADLAALFESVRLADVAARLRAGAAEKGCR